MLEGKEWKMRARERMTILPVLQPSTPQQSALLSCAAAAAAAAVAAAAAQAQNRCSTGSHRVMISISNITSNAILKLAFLVRLLKDGYTWHHPTGSSGGFRIFGGIRNKFILPRNDCILTCPTRFQSGFLGIQGIPENEVQPERNPKPECTS